MKSFNRPRDGLSRKSTNSALSHGEPGVSVFIGMNIGLPKSKKKKKTKGDFFFLIFSDAYRPFGRSSESKTNNIPGDWMVYKNDIT